MPCGWQCSRRSRIRFLRVVQLALLYSLLILNTFLLVMTKLIILNFFLGLSGEVCTIVFTPEMFISFGLIIGVYQKFPKPIKAFWWYTLITCLLLLVLQIVEIVHTTFKNGIENSIYTFVGLYMQTLCIVSIRVSVQELEKLRAHTSYVSAPYQLHPVANAELNVESNETHTTVIPIDV